MIYHEGLPGHHLQMSLLAENTALHPIGREQTELRMFALNGYLEGWAEYAACARRSACTPICGTGTGG